MSATGLGIVSLTARCPPTRIKRTIDRALVSALVARLDRRVAFSVTVVDRELYVAIRTENLKGAVVRLYLEV